MFYPLITDENAQKPNFKMCCNTEYMCNYIKKYILAGQTFNVEKMAMLRERCLAYMLKNWASSRENLSPGFPKRRVSNQSPQLHRLAGKLKFRS